MTRKYEFRDAEERVPLETIVQTTFPTVLQVFQVQARVAAYLAVPAIVTAGMAANILLRRPACVAMCICMQD